MNVSRDKLILLVISLFFVACSEKKDDPKIVDLSGSYYTEKVEHSDYYEPETSYVLDNKGKVTITYVHEIKDSNGQPLIYKEIYVGSYSVSGSKISVTNFKAQSVCKGEKESNKPIDFTVTFRKENGSIILIDGEEEIVLKPTPDGLVKKFDSAKLCVDTHITSEDIDEIKPSTPEETPIEPSTETLNENSTEKREPTQPRTTVTLPPQISPVVVRPPGNNKQPDLVPYIEFDNESYVEKVVDAANVSCADKNECPEFVGLFIGKKRANKIQMYQCSTTYIGNGYFSTNSHCYHRDISTYGRSFVQNCSNEIWVKLPETGDYEAQTLNCEKVIYLTDMVPRTLIESDDDANKGREAFDVMIFKVKETVNRPEAKINFDSPVVIGEKLTAWTVNPVLGKPGINGIIEKKTCSTYDHNSKRAAFKLDSRLSDSVYQSVHVNSCDKNMMKGNSGSTLFNSKREGVAVFSHIYIENENDTQSDSGYGTKYSCLGDINDGDKQIFSGSQMSQCRTLSNRDVETIRENVRIREHNDVVESVREIREKIRVVFNESQTIIGGKISAEPSLARNKFDSRQQGISFGSPDWISSFKEYQASPSFRYAPLKNFDENAMGIRSENGQIIFDVNSLGIARNIFGESVPVRLDDFSVFEVQFPSCIKIDREQLSRRRTDNRLNPFSSITYEYGEIKIKLPTNAYVADYRYEPRLITDENIDLISVNKKDIRTGYLPFDIYFKIDKSGYLSQMQFEPEQDLETSDLAKKIKAGFKQYCR